MMDGEELRRGEDDVDLPRGKAGEDLGADVRRGLAREDAGGKAELGELPGDMEALVCHEGAQRVHEDARLLAREGEARGVYVEDEGLATARRHDAKGALARGKRVEGELLRGKQVMVADETMDERCRKVLARGRGGGVACGHCREQALARV